MVLASSLLPFMDIAVLARHLCWLRAADRPCVYALLLWDSAQFVSSFGPVTGTYHQKSIPGVPRLNCKNSLNIKTSWAWELCIVCWYHHWCKVWELHNAENVRLVYTVVILSIASWSIDNCLSAVITTSHPPLPCQLRSGISSTMRKSYLVHPLKQKSETLPIWREPLRNNIPNWMSRLLIWSFGGARNLRCCPPNPGKCYNNAFLKLTSSKRNKSLSLLAVQKLQILSLVKRRCCWSEFLVRSLVLKCVPCPYHSFPLW